MYVAQYGIFQFSPLCARIFLVGFTFTALIALPAAAEHYELAYYGPLEPVLKNSDPRLHNYRNVVMGSGFVFTAFFMAGLFRLVLFAPSPSTKLPSWGPLAAAAFIAGILALFVVYAIVGKRFAAHPESTTAAAVLTTGIFLACTYFTDKELFHLTFWFFLSAVIVLSMRDSANRLLSALDFRNWFFIILAIGFYIAAVFGSVQSKVGGGAPTPVVFNLNKPVAWLDSTTAKVSLLDEANQGVYVLTSGKTKALFIPRNDVGSLYFGPAEDVMKSK